MNQEQIIKKYLPEKADVKIYGNLIAYKISADNVLGVCGGLYHNHQLQLKAMTAFDERSENGYFKIMYVFGLPESNMFLAPFIQIKEGEGFPSLVKIIHGVSGYERKIRTFFGLNPVGHLAPSQIILHENWPEKLFPLRKDFDLHTRPEWAHETYEFGEVKGEGIYEIPVGPVHAGIIEPGHFRFSVAGEEIIMLEPKLGYVHKGSEKLFETLPMNDKIRLSERISGDTSFTHSLAFCEAVESLGGISVPERAKYLRVVYSEMERLANHFNDIGFIMLDTGFSFGGANGGRLREMIMRWNERLSGSRFLRGVNVLGGVTKDINSHIKEELIRSLESIKKDFSEVMEISEDSDSLLNRLKDTGTVERQIVSDHGGVGIAAKGVGIATDARIDYPYAAYDKIKFDIATEKQGDVYARFNVRIKEVYSSIEIIKSALEKMVKGDIAAVTKTVSLKKNFYGVGMTEGWRGDILYLVSTDSKGNISRVDVRDPSFVNWPLLSHAAKGNVVPDFPLMNKSFNLSYSGNDL